MRQKTLKIILKMLMSYFCDSRSCMWGRSEIFVTIIEGSLEFDIILLQLWSKIALSLRLPKLQIASNNIVFSSLFSHIEHKTLKNVLASGLSRSYYDLWRIRFWGRWDGFSRSWLTTVFGLFALQVCCTSYVGICLNNVHSLASIISGFILFRCCVLVRIFLMAFLSLKCWLEDNFR